MVPDFIKSFYNLRYCNNFSLLLDLDQQQERGRTELFRVQHKIKRAKLPHFFLEGSHALLTETSQEELAVNKVCHSQRAPPSLSLMPVKNI